MYDRIIFYLQNVINPMEEVQPRYTENMQSTNLISMRPKSHEARNQETYIRMNMYSKLSKTYV